MKDKKYMHILTRLEAAGFQAYIVGGCVRDMIMERQPNDFDITTNATPDRITEIFADEKVIPTGIKHGTVTVIYKNEPFEITTFRVDGNYSDSRRPDSVKFTSSLKDDLSRRDFTMNAIAMDSKGKIYDYFGGESDIKNRIIRCVGDPEKRFTEDALRILRAVRFASVLDFSIEPNTAEAALYLRERLGLVSAERIRTELVKLICGINVVGTMLEYRDIIGQIIPDMIPCFDFDQRSVYHKYNVYEHIVRSIDKIPTGQRDTEILRTALLFHDIGKPATFTLDISGKGHFKGHAGVSAEMARRIMKELTFDNRTIETVCTIIANHSEKKFNTGLSEYDIKRMIYKMGAENFLLTARAKLADNSAKHDFVLSENDELLKCISTAQNLIENNICMSLSQLDINGNDLIELGFRGRATGECLEILLDMVMKSKLENNRTSLIQYADKKLDYIRNQK